MTFKEIAAASNGTGGPIVGSAGVNPGGVGGSYAAMLVDVEVDSETGKTTILRCTPFTDVGKAIHPDYVEGQIQGGVVHVIDLGYISMYHWWRWDNYHKHLDNGC